MARWKFKKGYTLFSVGSRPTTTNNTQIWHNQLIVSVLTAVKVDRQQTASIKNTFDDVINRTLPNITEFKWRKT